MSRTGKLIVPLVLALSVAGAALAPAASAAPAMRYHGCPDGQVLPITTPCP